MPDLDPNLSVSDDSNPESTPAEETPEPSASAEIPTEPEAPEAPEAATPEATEAAAPEPVAEATTVPVPVARPEAVAN